jgi:putative Ca2+/H+ antiporter (TMEM165/GDT1 family)
VSLLTILGAFAVIFPAELPDKTALASLMLGTRYRASLVFAGVAAAFALHVVLAIVAGSLLHLIPHKPLQIIVGVLFALGAALLLRGRHEEEEGEEQLEVPSLSSWKVVATSFSIILVAEFGDLTQIVTANLAAGSKHPVSVGIGAVLALWAVGGIAILGGQKLVAKVSLRRITQVAALVMLVLAVVSIVDAFA